MPHFSRPLREVGPVHHLGPERGWVTGHRPQVGLCPSLAGEPKNLKRYCCAGDVVLEPEQWREQLSRLCLWGIGSGEGQWLGDPQDESTGHTKIIGSICRPGPTSRKEREKWGTLRFSVIVHRTGGRCELPASLNA